MSEPTFDMSAAATQLDNAFAAESAPVTEPVAEPTFTAPVAEPTTPVAAPQVGGHPAWNDILTAVPTSLHDALRPKLAEWDAGVQKKLQEVHSQYEPYKPFIGADPQQLAAAQQLFNVLNTNPRALFDQLAEHYGFGGEQGPNADEEFDLSGDLPEDPRIAQLAQQQEAIMAQMQAAQEAQLAAQASSWLETTMDGIVSSYKQRGIEPDVEYIIGMAATLANARPDLPQEEIMKAAVAKHDEALQRFSGARTAASNAPNVVSPNGAIPSSNFDATKLSGDERRKLGADLLAQALRGS